MLNLIAWFFLLLLLSPLYVSGACGTARLGRHRYCSLDQSLDYLRDGGSALLWIVWAVMILVAIVATVRGADDPDSNESSSNRSSSNRSSSNPSSSD